MLERSDGTRTIGVTDNNFKSVCIANNLSYETEKLKIGLSDEVTEVFMKRFDELEKRIDDLMPKKAVSRAKKESDEE